jgi:8-oxo-dGTP pyrophosphatase MutT (NUDIX family)
MSFRIAASLQSRQISRSNFLNSTPAATRPNKVVVGVLIFLSDKILLLQRAATERHYPNIWELPSGKVEAEDATLLDAAARECLEETNLTVTAFVGEGKSLKYSIPGAGSSLQLNFDVEVREGDPVIVNPEEHQGYRWCDEKEVEMVAVTDAIKDILTDAFDRRNRNGGPRG